MSTVPSDSSSMYSAVVVSRLALFNRSFPVPGSAFAVDVSKV
jgi:hypothetical protein